VSEVSGPAAAAGTFRIGGDILVNRLGFGAMRITGPGVWGEPETPAEARRVLGSLGALGINLVDTADSYGPEVSENLIRDALHPYDGFLIATKGGLTRPGPGKWVPDGRPEYLRKCVEGSLARLNVDTIDLWQLHRIDPKVPRDEQLAAVAEMRKEGLIRHVGLSEVTVADIEAARRHVPVATVQNLYNLTNRASENVLDHCERHGIGFIPWFPLGNGELAKPGSPLAAIARARGASASQIALAWLLKRSPVMLPIPGTGRLAHLEENARAAPLDLTEEEFAALDAIAAKSSRR
jgi:aryl-alcohol dehydrogenase-like predicted oxidoreductase